MLYAERALKRTCVLVRIPGVHPEIIRKQAGSETDIPAGIEQYIERKPSFPQVAAVYLHKPHVNVVPLGEKVSGQLHGFGFGIRGIASPGRIVADGEGVPPALNPNDRLCQGRIDRWAALSAKCCQDKKTLDNHWSLSERNYRHGLPDYK